jgi:hypothetical protein
MKKLIFLFLILLVGTAVVFAVPVQPPGDITLEAAFSGSGSITATPETVLAEVPVAGTVASMILAIPDYKTSEAGKPIVGKSNPVPDFYLLC